MSIGHKVRYLRKKKQMKQEDLSKGICSVSYLSKIENEILQPSDETMQLLLNRLGYIEETNALTRIQELLAQWNINFMKRDEKESKKLYHYFQENDFINEGIQLEYRVLRIQYYLQHNMIAHVRKELVDLTKKIIDMPLKTKFYFFKHSAYYYYQVGKIGEAATNIIESQKFISFLELSTLELADFYYAFSFVNSKNNDTKTAVKYAEMALSSYQTIYMLTKCVDCHIILGICHKRNFHYEMAFEHYEAAHTLAKEIDYQEMLHPIMHNLSSLYSILGQHDEALGLLQELYSELSDLESYTSARIVLSLVKEYCKVGRKSEAAQCLNKMYHMIHKDPSLISLRSEYIFFDLMLGDQFEELDRKMEKNIIPELMKQNKYLTLSGFCDYLGEYYLEQSKYKKSSYYFQLGKELMVKSLQKNIGVKV
ncbi:helix-turn-helix domain-containing protein [Rossellomorea sp. SC111]|uniref:helix-turn-helix domain-containing protein n=1 Tax=Rossellomorea sp. SC111 TaxID=2968985 RepID=UPI00215A1111|nr:helix-turn-helix domain-containing protein [Rossellomorea sp. SC111]MCR8850509.1 helix-turn-helix domain-containing protein [Rossellomorea sp. SC111]